MNDVCMYVCMYVCIYVHIKSVATRIKAVDGN